MESMSEGLPHSRTAANDGTADNESSFHHDNATATATHHVAFASSAASHHHAPSASPASTTAAVRRLSSNKMLDPSRPRRLSSTTTPREAHMDALIAARRESMKCLFPDVASNHPVHQQHEDEEEGQQQQQQNNLSKSTLEQQSEFVRKLRSLEEKTNPTSSSSSSSRRTPMEIRLKNLTFQVPRIESEDRKIHTIYNSSPLYKIHKFMKRSISSIREMKKNGTALSSGNSSTGEEGYTNVLSNINLVLKPTKMYLILGPPLSGKTSLLKAIGGMLLQSQKTTVLSGSIQYNNVNVLDDKNRELIQNLVAFVRQHDCHAARLTVDETFTFARNCKDSNSNSGGKQQEKGGRNNRVESTLEALGLAYVKDTFVGDEAVRGVSGGQRRRVTLGEMLVFDTPLLCGDEISTGLDTASTIDILSILSYMTRLFHRVTVVSLLQPSPEAVALFDEIILLGDGGTVLFTGPTENAAKYFSRLGYKQPDGMDSADYLLAVASSDRHLLYRADDEEDEVENESSSVQHDDDKMKTSQKLGKMFSNSEYSTVISRNYTTINRCFYKLTEVQYSH